MLKTIGKTVIVLWSLVLVLVMLNNRHPACGVSYQADMVPDNEWFDDASTQYVTDDNVMLDAGSADKPKQHKSLITTDQFKHLNIKVH